MAILKLRRGTSIPSLAESELFYHTSLDTLVVGDGSNSHILLKSGSNTVNLVDISGTISASYIHVTNDLTIKGNLTLGDQDTDNIVISAELSSSLIPDVNNTFDVGSSLKKWRHLYATSASIDELVVDGSGIVSSSQQISNYNTFLEIDGMGVFSGSSQVNADTITNFDTNVKDKMNDDGVISGSSQLTTEFDTRYLNTNGDSVISSSAQLTTEFDTRYLNTDGDSVVSSSAQLTSDFDTRYLNTNGDGVISSSAQLDGVFLEINGDSVVSGSQQIIDLLPSGVVSGSSQVNANTITNFDTNVKDKMNSDGVLSGSAQLDGVFLEINGDSVVSSSAQISGYNTFLEINGDGVVSGSSQINSLFVGTAVSTSLDSRIVSLEADTHTHSNKTQLDTINQNLSTTSDVTFNTGSFTGNMTITGDLTVLGSSVEIQTTELRIEDKLITVASGSADSAAADGAGLEIDGAGKSLKWDHNTSQFVFDAQVSSSVGFKGEGGLLTGIDTDQVTEATNLYYTDARVKSKLNTENVVSGSSQLTSDFDSRYLNTNGDSVVSSSAQLTSDFDTRYLNTNGDGVISSSAQLDSVFLEINGDSVVSSSAQVITHLNGSGVVSGSSQLDSVFLEINGDSVVSGSSQIDVTATTNYSSINQYSDTKVKTKLNVEGVLSGSAQVISSLPSGTVSGSSQITDGSGIISSSTFVSNQQGSFTSSVNGTNTNIDLGLESTDSPSFAGITLNSVSSGPSNEYTALFLSGSDNSVVRRELATAAFYHVSSSISDGNTAVLGNAGAVKAYVDAQIIEAGAGDITGVTPVVGGGLAGGGTVGDVSMSIDTGSAHFRDGIKEKLNIEGVVSGSTNFLNANGDGVISSSAQLENVFLEINGDGVVSGSVLRPNGDGVISGSSQVNADSVTNFDSNVLTYINDLGVHSGSFLGTATTTNLSEGTNLYYTDARVKTKLNAEGVFSSSAQIEGNFLEVNGDSVVSGSVQIDHNQTTNYTASRHIDHSQITVGSGKGLIGGGTIDTNRSITLATGSSHFGEGVINALTGSGIVSSSTQIDSLGFLQVNGDGVLSGSIADQLPSGVISGSAQIDRTWTLGASGTNHYTFTGPGLTGAESDPTIYLTRGETYRFVNNMGAHPFRIQSTPNGSAGTAYNDGVTNNNVSSGTLIIDVQFDAPSKLYYQCTAHSNMGGVIHIIDERPSGVISGSSQVTIGGDATGSANDINVVAINGVTITNAEATQLANINTSTISTTQWGYVGALNQNLGTTNDVQFNDLVLSGDLTVQGTTTTLNTQELTIEDKLLSVASGSTTTAAADGGGFHISGANASITWDNGNSRLAVNKSTHFTGNVQATGDVVAYASSDERLKDNIKPIENPIEKINQISGNSFVWNEEKQNIYKGKDYGVVAQEIEKILPELVNEREDGYKAVKYDKLISLLIEGVKELSKEVNDLKNKIGE